MKLLLDVHISKATLNALAKLAPAIEADHLADWHDGTFRNAPDVDILAACRIEQRVFVTFDLATIPDLLRHWAAEGQDHAGVLFGDEETVRPDDPAQMARSLKALAAEIGPTDTTNLVRFLQLKRR